MDRQTDRPLVAICSQKGSAVLSMFAGMVGLRVPKQATHRSRRGDTDYGGEETGPKRDGCR